MISCGPVVVDGFGGVIGSSVAGPIAAVVCSRVRTGGD